MNASNDELQHLRQSLRAFLHGPGEDRRSPPGGQSVLALMQGACVAQRAAALRRGLALGCDDVPAAWRVPAAQAAELAALLEQLVAEALESNGRGGVWLSATADADEVCVQVRQTGDGLTLEQLGRLHGAARRHPGLDAAAAARRARALGARLHLELGETVVCYRLVIPMERDGTRA